MADSGPSRSFGRFELIRMLGQGGFGEVWLANDPQRDAQIALKVLHQGLMSDGHFVKSVQREATLTQKIDHPNVVKILEIGETAGRMYIAMEFIDGVTLADAIKDGRRWSIQQVLMLVNQLASALDATHAEGVVHRDVKPANILIDSDGQAHLVDFGLAHAAMSSIGASSNSVGLGTAAYLSPEQAGGQAGDRRADVYSLGVIAYELLTGQTPFQADTLMGYMMAHQNESPPYPAKYNPGISRHLQAVILKALHKDPDKRHKTAGAFATALQKASVRKFRKARTKSSSPVGRALSWATAAIVMMAIPVGVFATGIAPLPPVLQEMIKVVIPPTAEDGPLVLAEDTPTLAPSPGEAAVATEMPELETPELEPEEPTPTETLSPTLTEMPTEIPTLTMTSTSTTTPTSTFTPSPTATPTSSSTPTPTATSESMDLNEEDFTAYRLEVVSGSTESGKGKLVVQMAYGDGRPVTGQWIEVYSQKQDISQNWVVDKSVAHGRTSNAGLAEFALSQGEYIVGTDLPGYNWGNASDTQGLHSVPLEIGKVTQLQISLGQLMIGFRRGDGNVIDGQWVEVYRQKVDVGGKWVTAGSSIRHGRTDNSGSIVFNVVPGRYIVQSDFAGYNWGDANDVQGFADFPVPPGQVTRLIYDLGRLAIGLKGNDGSALTGKWVEVYTQRAGLDGKPVPGTSVARGRTDNAGMLWFNLTHGDYAVLIDDRYTYNVTLESGRITYWDGQTAKIMDP